MLPGIFFLFYTMLLDAEVLDKIACGKMTVQKYVLELSLLAKQRWQDGLVLLKAYSISHNITLLCAVEHEQSS